MVRFFFPLLDGQTKYSLVSNIGYDQYVKFRGIGIFWLSMVGYKNKDRNEKGVEEVPMKISIYQVSLKIL